MRIEIRDLSSYHTYPRLVHAMFGVLWQDYNERTELHEITMFVNCELPVFVCLCFLLIYTNNMSNTNYLGNKHAAFYRFFQDSKFTSNYEITLFGPLSHRCTDAHTNRDTCFSGISNTGTYLNDVLIR